MGDAIAITHVKASAYTIPTDGTEADGTIKWDSTTMVLVEIEAGGKKGLGYTYGHFAIAAVIEKTLKYLLMDRDVMRHPCITSDLTKGIRNDGGCGIAMMAVSAIDTALCDLKAKILNVPLAILLGIAREEILVYGSGGFTSYSDEQLEKQLGEWVDVGIKYVKMKIGTHIEKDFQRVQAARRAIGTKTNLYVDANGAYTVREALDMAHRFESCGVTWFEEPVPSDDLKGLSFVRAHAPKGMVIAAGEYGYNLPYYERMLEESAVDILQADATRCGGISGFLDAGKLCFAHQLPYSSHCAPALHLHPSMALPSFFIAEYFHDHVRIENMLLDGTPVLTKGYLKPDLTRPGMGFDFKYKDAAQYKVA